MEPPDSNISTKMNAKDLRIVFMGTPEFAVPSLRALVRSGYNVVGVVTTPDKPAGRGQKLHESDVKIAARELELPILQPEKLRDPAFVSAMEELRPDLGIVIAFRMLPEVVWAMPRLGTFNLHASLLPQYRGAAPINWAIINGESKTGVTTFLLNHEIDKGAILGQVEMPIQPEDNVGTLYGRLMTVGADLVVQTVERIAAGEITPVVQPDEDTSLRPAPKIFKNDCLIDWTQSGKRIIDFIRGLSPYPAAWTRLLREEQERIRPRFSKRASKPVVRKLHAARSTPTTANTCGSDVRTVGSTSSRCNYPARNAWQRKSCCSDSAMQTPTSVDKTPSAIRITRKSEEGFLDRKHQSPGRNARQQKQ